MVAQIRVVTFTTPAAADPAAFPVTHVDITEAFNCAILIYTRTTDEDSNSPGGCMGVGFVSTEAGGSADNDASSTVALRDAQPSTTQAFQDESGGASGECIRASNPGVSVVTIAEFSAAIAGGVELNFTTRTEQVKCTAILFAGLSRSAIGNCTFTDGGITHEDVGNAGTGEFQPDLLVFLSSDTSLDAGGVSNGQPKIGFAINPASGIQQISAYLNIDLGTDPTAADGYYRTDCATAGFIGNRVAEMDRIQITSFDSTGFNATAIDTGSGNSPQANYLAIKWADSSRIRTALAHLPVAASAGNQTYNTFGFTPDLVFGMSHLMTVADTLDGVEANTCSAGYFVTGRHGSRAVSVHHDHGHTIDSGAQTDANTRQGDHAVLTLTGLGAVAHQASWVGGSGSGGFILNFATAAQAGTLTALGIQVIPEPPRVVRRSGRRATRRSRMRYRRTSALGGVRVSFPLSRLLRAVQRFRRAMQRRLRWRPKLPTVAPMPSVPTVTGQESDGSVFSAGAKRGEVSSGGAEAGGVF